MCYFSHVKFVGSVLCPKILSILVNVPNTLENSVYSSVVLNVLYMSSNLSLVQNF